MSAHASSNPAALRRRAVLGGGMALALGPALPAAARTAAITPIPSGYVRVGQAAGVPATVLFCVACQESVLRFGDKALPYPWTLCVRGRAQRFDTYDAAVDRLQECLRAGITNVDCGALQVNWGWHSARLVSPQRALDAYANLGVGAVLLREQFEAAGGNWFDAVGRYHHPTDRSRAVPYATAVFGRMQRIVRPDAQPASGAIGRMRRFVEGGADA